MTIKDLTLEDIKEMALRDGLVVAIVEELEKLSTIDLKAVLTQLKISRAMGED